MPRPLESRRRTNASAPSGAAYEVDYFAWTQSQLEALRMQRVDDLDMQNLAEEIGDLGISVKREIKSRLLVLLVHLLKWKYQPNNQSNSWKGSISEQRNEISSELRASPSLKSYPASVLAKQYAVARLNASGETGLELNRFPELCPFSIGETLDPTFFPEDDGWPTP